MAETPYITKNPGDIIRAGDWNALQVQARQEIHGHGHKGGQDGTPIERAGIAANAVDGSRIDPASLVAVKSLKIDGRTVLDEINALMAGKFDKSGGSIKGDVAIHGRSITLGLDGNGGGQLVLGNNPNDNRIFLEAYNTAGNGSAAEMLLTGYLSQDLPQLSFRAVNTSTNGNLNVGGSTQLSAGKTEANGLRFAKDPGGGGGDVAWLRFYPRTNESCTLELGIANDPDDHIALMSSGNVGINTLEPKRKLHVENSEIHAGGANAGLSFSSRDSNGGAFVDSPGSGERWLWYAQGGTARLWSGADKLRVGNDGSLWVAGNTTLDGNLTVSAKAITLGLNDNGGGQLMICNNANDNKIFLEGFSTNGDASASELLITGRWTSNLPLISLYADTTTAKGALTVGADLTVSGRSKSNNTRTQVTAGNHVSTNSTAFVDVPNLRMDFSVGAGPVLFIVKVAGVQTQGAANVRAHFRLLIDGSQWAYDEQEFHNNGWELRDVCLFALPSLSAGTHNVALQWRTDGNEVHCSWYGGTRGIFAIEL